MLVRPAVPEDGPAAAGVLAAVAQEGIYIAADPPVDVAKRGRRFEQQLASRDVVAWVLEDDGRAVGHLALELLSWNPGVARLGVALLADARGRGGGRELLEAAVAWARDSDLRKIELEVWLENGRAIALYARAGFAVEGLRRDHYRRSDGSLRSTLVMALFV